METRRISERTSSSSSNLATTAPSTGRSGEDLERGLPDTVVFMGTDEKAQSPPWLSAWSNNEAFKVASRMPCEPFSSCPDSIFVSETHGAKVYPGLIFSIFQDDAARDWLLNYRNPGCTTSLHRFELAQGVQSCSWAYWLDLVGKEGPQLRYGPKVTRRPEVWLVDRNPQVGNPTSLACVHGL